MRQMLLGLAIAFAALASTGVAEAHHRGHHGGGYGGHYGGHHGGYDRGYRRGYGRGYGRGHGHGHHGYGHSKYRRDNDGWKYVAGALVLGATIAAVTAPRERVVVRERVVRQPSYGGVRYRLDRYGNCTRIRDDGYGREILTDVDPSYCY